MKENIHSPSKVGNVGKVDEVKITRALISTWDKSHLEEVAKSLLQFGVEIISTGGTLQYLKELEIPVTPIEQVTGNPEAFGGRMKTLSFQVGSSLLYRRDHPQDQLDKERLHISPIDLVIGNLYPFAKVKSEGGDLNELIEMIDIGGPTFLRAGAKNHAHVTVLSSPEQYDSFLQHYQEKKGKTDLAFRQQMAMAVFTLTADYDAQVAQGLKEKMGGLQSSFDSCLREIGQLQADHGWELRYGENPHQRAKIYPWPQGHSPGIIQAKIIQGKALSSNNILDAEAAWKCASDIQTDGALCTVAIVKHMNPCGVAAGKNLQQVLETAWNCDPTSAFGGILCSTVPFTLEAVLWLKDKFLEVIVAPSIEEGVAEVLAQKKNLRVLLLPPRPKKLGEVMVRSVSGGLLFQDEDEGEDEGEGLRSVSFLPFPEAKLPLAKFGIMATKHLKSNAIALVEERGEGQEKIFTLASVGMGQPNRIEALKRLALPKVNGRDLCQVLLISDAFFPFPDTVHEAYAGGIQYLVQPGGSIRDDEVIKACDELAMKMLFTGRRHFRH